MYTKFNNPFPKAPISTSVLLKTVLTFLFILMVLPVQSQDKSRFNRAPGTGLQGHGLLNQSKLDFLHSLSQYDQLSASQEAQARESMLALNNEARANRNFRKEVGCKNALNLPASLPPLVLDERLNKLAKEQADYQARTLTCTHLNKDYPDAHNSSKNFGNRVNAHPNMGYILEACGWEDDLSAYPYVWMSSETHYRPTWSLDDLGPVTAVGFGFTKGSDGNWYATAAWANIEDTQQPASAGTPAPTKPTTSTNPKPTSTDANAGTLPIQKGTEMIVGKKYYSTDKTHYMVFQGDGNLVTYRSSDDGFVWGSYNNLNTPLWGKKAVMQTDGNFCFYDANDRWIWGTQTQGSEVSINGSGGLVVNDASGNQIWPSR